MPTYHRHVDPPKEKKTIKEYPIKKPYKKEIEETPPEKVEETKPEVREKVKKEANKQNAN